MNTPDFSSTLYDCATLCALNRKEGKCKENYDSYACNSCRLYIKKFVTADPSEADLFMLQAEGRASEIYKTTIRNWIGIIIILGLVIWGISYVAYHYNKGQKEKEQYRLERNIREIRETPKAVVQSNEHSNIEKTLYKVADDLFKKKDVNGDKLVNCIDAAVLFYQYYPDKDKVCIELNVNYATDMNHLFNCVLMEGNWRAIEPQAYYKGYRSYFMRDVWKEEYTSTYNKDVTQDYLRYVK